MTESQQETDWARLVTRAFNEAGFVERLKAEPETVLEEMGIAPTKGMVQGIKKIDLDKVADLAASLGGNPHVLAPG